MLMTLCLLILSRAISDAFNAKMPVAAALLLEFPLPGKKKVFRNQRFPLDNVGRYYGMHMMRLVQLEHIGNSELNPPLLYHY